MSTHDKTGGPAFPTYPTHTPGMTLRDYFAAHALVGMLSGGTILRNHADYGVKAYDLADAMVAAREAKP